MKERDLTKLGIARVFDVPPWLVGQTPRPRFPRTRWALRKVWPL